MLRLGLRGAPRSYIHSLIPYMHALHASSGQLPNPILWSYLLSVRWKGVLSDNERGVGGEFTHSLDLYEPAFIKRLPPDPSPSSGILVQIDIWIALSSIFSLSTGSHLLTVTSEQTARRQAVQFGLCLLLLYSALPTLGPRMPPHH